MSKVYRAIYMAAVAVADWATARQWELDKRKLGIK